MKTDAERDLVQAFSRGLDVILAFSDHRPRMTLSEVAVITGLPRPTARRLLLTLVDREFATTDGRSFALTPRVLSLGYAYLSSLDLVAVAEPHMEDVTHATGEGCTLATLDGADVVYVARVSTRRIARLPLAAGTRLPAHATSLGHVLLADLDERELAAYFDRADLVGLTGRTLRTRDGLLERLEVVRARGWADVDQELAEGLRSLSVPVHDASGRTIAALGLSVTASTTDIATVERDYLPHLQRAAEATSRGLGAEQATPEVRIHP